MRSEPTQPLDLLVLGGGMAGLSAAAAAARGGARVAVVEKGDVLGGSAVYAGFVWTAPDHAVMSAVNPGADADLRARVVSDYAAGIDWMRSLGVEVRDPVTVLGYGHGSQTDLAGYLNACERVVRETGDVLRQARVQRLTLQDGCVTGAEVAEADGTRRTIAARTTLLATGGFGGDPELRARRIHPLARDIPLRANPNSTGDGLRLAEEAGAAFVGNDAGFYGHLIPSNVGYGNPLEFTDLTFYHSEHGVLLNLEGRRFCDETVGDHLSTLAVLEQPEARALLVTDQRVHDEWMLKPYVAGAETLDKFALAYKRGARAAIAEDLDELEALPEEWGYPGPESRDALRAFNQQCESGRPDPRREFDAAPLVTPPYYVIEVIPAITFTFGGVRIDSRARVLDERGTPIPGLLAAGADAGGVYHRAYAGGLAAALAFGLQAARTALDASVTGSPRS